MTDSAPAGPGGDQPGSTVAAGAATREVGEPLRTDRGPLERLQHLLHAQPVLGPAAVLVIMVAVFSLLSPRFLMPTNLSLIVQQVMVVGTLAIGQTIIILTAGIDLSVGAIMLLATVSMGRSRPRRGCRGSSSWASDSPSGSAAAC